MKTTPLILATLIFLLIPLKPALSWTGYDYENKTEIEIGPGNLVREGLLIEFYDSKSDNYHSGRILFIESVAGGTRIQLKDLDQNEKERSFIMGDED